MTTSNRHVGPSALVLDPERTHLDILRDALQLLETYPPKDEVYRRGCAMGQYDCAACGFPYDHAAPGLTHETFRNHEYSAPCRYMRAVAELNAWIRVESDIERRAEEDDS